MSTKRITRVAVNNSSGLKRLKKQRKLEDRTDWARLRAMKDEDIDYSDIPDISDADIAHARWVGSPETKVTISIRMDPDLLAWFRKNGRGYQSRIHAVLRAFQRSRLDRKPKKTGRRAA